jgi:hypothetical protein
LPCFFFGGQFDPGAVDPGAAVVGLVDAVVVDVVVVDVVVVVVFFRLGLVVDVVADEAVGAAAVVRPGWWTAGWAT